MTEIILYDYMPTVPAWRQVECDACQHAVWAPYIPGTMWEPPDGGYLEECKSGTSWDLLERWEEAEIAIPVVCPNFQPFPAGSCVCCNQTIQGYRHTHQQWAIDFWSGEAGPVCSDTCKLIEKMVFEVEQREYNQAMDDQEEFSRQWWEQKSDEEFWQLLQEEDVI